MLKWLQKLPLLLNNVRLLHSEDASHNCVHTSRLGTLPGELGKYSSVLVLHAWPDVRTVVRTVTVVVVVAIVLVVVVALAIVLVTVLPVFVVVIALMVVVVVVATVVVVSSMVNEIASATALVFSHAVLT